MKNDLDLAALKLEASKFAKSQSNHKEPVLFGVTDGKAVGTYIEHRFQNHLLETYSHVFGSSAKGIDFPGLGVDLKTTSITQPQSSCPFRSARQKIYGLGYHLLVFVYAKTDDHKLKTGCLDILHTVFVDAARTADYQTTKGVNGILDNGGNLDDLLAFFSERSLPVDDIQALELAKEVIRKRPLEGYLTISNALQWRLQYRRVIELAGKTEGVENL